MNTECVKLAGYFENKDVVSFETKTLLDNDYAVLPAVMMVEGTYTPYVENFTEKSALKFTTKELKRSINSWNGRPVSIDHPDNQQSCNCPSNYQKRWIGYVFNTRMDGTRNRMLSDIWIDKNRGSSIIDMFSKGNEVDISIGAYGDLVPSNDNDADFLMTNIVGDHLAVLPNGIGACSWKDGCGIRAMKQVIPKKGNVMDKDCSKKYVAAVSSSARTPAYDGIEDVSWEKVDKSLSAYISGYYKQTNSDVDENIGNSVSTLPSVVKEWIASKTLLGDTSADNSRDLIFFPVVNPMTNKLNRGALMAVLGGRGDSANISEQAKESAQNKAKSLLQDKFKVGVKSMNKKENCLEPTKESSSPHVHLSNADKAEKVEQKRDFDLEQWLSQLPEEAHNYMVNSMRSYETLRKRHIEKIVGCKKVNFCSEALSKISDMSLLENISLLVDAANVVEHNVDNRGEEEKVNYQFRTSSGIEENEEYAPFKVITWNR